MDRRKALFLTAGVFGSALIGSELFLSGCTRKKELNLLLTEADIHFLDEVGEVILPETERSPGARAAGIGQFMKVIVTDCYDEKEQRIFTEGIDQINQLSKSTYGAGYLELDASQKHELLVKLDNEARQGPDTNDPHFFRMMKELTLWGYFTSEPGATQALRYLPISGEYKGCVPYKTGDKAWF